MITTPNVDALPARLRFLFGGKIGMMDEFSDPTRVSPIFVDLLLRQLLPQAGLRMADHKLFPPKGYRGDSTLGNHHIFALEAAK